MYYALARITIEFLVTVVESCISRTHVWYGKKASSVMQFWGFWAWEYHRGKHGTGTKDGGHQSRYHFTYP